MTLRRTWSAALLLVAAAAGCRDNTTCTIGDLLCTDAEGESAAFDGTQVRECSDDESKGGDEDGEFVVLEDCGENDGLCYDDLHIAGVTTGCTTQACIDSGDPCIEPDAGDCIGDTLRRCAVVDSATGCNQYVNVQDCAETGETCLLVDGAAACG